MKKRILIIFIFLVCLIVPSVLVIANTTKDNSTIGILEIFKIEMVYDGQLSEDKAIVTLAILGNIYKPYVEWSQVYISPEHNKKRVLLRATHFSTTEGSIKNVKVDKNMNDFSFQLISPEGEVIQIVAKKEAGTSTYFIEGLGLVYIKTFDKKTKIEWQSTDKKFVLPYKEVF